MKNTSIRFLSTLILLTAITFSACKKNKPGDPEPPDPDPDPPTALSDADSLKYLMYHYMQISFVDGGRDVDYFLPTYYWYKDVPQLDPLSDDYEDAQDLLNYMKTFAINPASGKPYDKYSFLDDGQVADEIQQGVAGDKGLDVTYAYDADDNIVLVVLYTGKNSPAGQAGVQRGWLITAINGQPVTYDGPGGANVTRVVNAVFYDDQASFTFKKLDGSEVTSTIAKATYNINPILFDTVYNVSGKKVGYFVFNTFASIEYNSAPTLTKQELDRVFSEFETAGAGYLIVDLRYNGGGAVNTAEYLAGKLAPATVANKEIYHYLYNDRLEAMKTEVGLESSVKFTQGGNLTLDNVYFITSDNTASASELTINSLKPYMDVFTVGDTSYGKPVGFFGFHISIFKNGVEKDLADLYAINFEFRNSNNVGEFYEGIPPNQLAADYIGEPWGSADDENLMKIFNHISTGSFSRSMMGIRSAKTRELKQPIEIPRHTLRFNGMVDYKMGKEIQQKARKMLEKDK